MAKGLARGRKGGRGCKAITVTVAIAMAHFFLEGRARARCKCHNKFVFSFFSLPFFLVFVLFRKKRE